MNGSKVSRTLLLSTTIISGIVLSFTIISAQQDLPRISFLCPYSISTTLFMAYNHYWPQMDSCGLTHVVTAGDDSSLNNSANLYLINSQLAENGNYNVWRYAMGVVNDYPVGGIDVHESYFTQKETGEDYHDPDGDRWVFRMRYNFDSSGVVLDSSFAGWHQPNGWTDDSKRLYFFTFTMKMDGDNSSAVPVAEVHIWEELESKSEQPIGQHGGLLWYDLEGESIPPANIIDTIYADDFLSPGQYEKVEVDSIKLKAYDSSAHKYYETHVEFKWLDTRDLYLDHLNVRDSFNYNLFVSADSSDHFAYVQDKLASRNAINPDLNFRFYVDEPMINQYKSFNKVDDLSRENPGVPLNGATCAGFTRWDPFEFAQIISPDELLFNLYTIHHYISNTSSGDNSLQKAWDRLIHGDSTLNWYGMRYAKNAADTKGCRFWMTVQACADYYGSGTNWSINLRAPTPEELSAEAHLALCYGATGIMYYAYPSLQDDGYRVWGLVTLKNASGGTIWVPQSGCYYEKNERWYAAQEINAKIDSLSDVLLSLNWQDAFVSHPNTIASHATFVESLYSAEFGTDTSYVEIGVFEHDDGTDYLMLVNRRCLSSETQTVTVWLDTDAYMIQDVYNRDVYGSDDGVFAGITLAPGEGRLFKLIDSDAAWTGAVYVHNSVTVPQGVRLTVEAGATVKFAPNSVLLINGVLQARGSDSNYISFISIQPAQQWSGILFADSSEDSLCVMKKCFIGYAGTGISFWGASPDTIGNILFHQCDIGIACENASPHVSAPEIYTAGTVPVGIYCAAGSAPQIDSVQFRGNGAEGTRGIHISGSDPVVRSGTISNFARGIDICGGAPDIRDVELSENTECAIACNWFEDPPPESVCDPCSAYIAYNDIFFNHIGIKSVNASPTVFHNRIVNDSVSVGVFCSGTDLPNLGDLSNADGTDDGCNDIWGNQVFDVLNEASDTVQAENNWWGPDSLDSSQFSGLVDYIPAREHSSDSIAPAAITDLSLNLIKVPSNSGIVLSWSEITTDVAGKMEFISHYVIYRDTTYDYEPTSSESLAAVPDTIYEYFDTGVVDSIGLNYYYLVKAVDYGTNKSDGSNRVGEFDIYLSKDGKNPFEEWPEE